MGFIEAIGDAMGAISDAERNWYTTRFKSMAQTWGDSWKQFGQGVTGGLQASQSLNRTLWGGAFGMASSYQPDQDSFGKGFRLFADSVLNVGQGALGGTIGGLLEAPVAHEATWLLDKAYRYAVARPMTWAWMQYADLGKNVQEARAGNKSMMDAYTETWLNKDVWFGDRGVWSDQIGGVTPGQALIYAVGGSIGQLNPLSTQDQSLGWYQAHDPRTPEGQAKYNSDNSEFILKYGSGTTDMLLNVVVDPSVPVAGATKLGKAHFVDNVATSSYIARKGHEAEVSSEAFTKLLDKAKASKTPEDLRWGTNLAYSRFGGQIATTLWAAAQHSDQLFRDTYVVLRGMDGLRDETGLGAWQRVKDTVPHLGSDLARIFANWNIGEDATMLGRNAEATQALQSLVLTDSDALIMGLANREGLWGSMQGVNSGEAQPRITLESRLRTGVHSWALDSAPVFIRKPVLGFMASQGWTPFIDSQDHTAIALRQFKANLERSGMPSDRINAWVSQWGAKGSREGRVEVHERAEDEALVAMAERAGLTTEQVAQAQADMSRMRAGARKQVSDQRVYLTEQVARLGAYNVAEGRPKEAASLRILNKDLTAGQKKGQFGNAFTMMSDVDGRLNAVALPETRMLPPQAADMKKPLLSTQTEPVIPTIDFRSLESQLKWYKRAHPYKMITDPVTGKRRTPLTEAEDAIATLERPGLLGPLAKMQKHMDAIISTADFANMLWKSSALLRPAQMPRNLADDILRRMLIFGKGALIMSAMQGTKRAFQNEGNRGVLRHERWQEQLTARGASRTRDVVVDADSETPHVAPPDPQAMNWPDLGSALVSGLIPIQVIVDRVEALARDHPRQVPPALYQAITASDRMIFHIDEDFESPMAPKNKAWHDRAVKRRIIEYYFPDQLTKFIDDMRVKGNTRPTTVTTQEIDRDSGAIARSMAKNVEVDYPQRQARFGGAFEWEKSREIGTSFNGPAISEEVQHRVPPPRYKQKSVTSEVPGHPIDPLATDVDHRMEWVKRVIDLHIQKKNLLREGRAGIDDNPDAIYRPGQVAVDPFSGKYLDNFDGLLDFDFLGPYTVLDIKESRPGGKRTGKPKLDRPPIYRVKKTGELTSESHFSAENPTDRMVNFIIDNVDHLLKPDHALGLSVTPEGNVRVSVIRRKPEANPGEELKPGSAAQRLTNFKYNEIQDAGHTGFNVKVRSWVGEGAGRDKYDGGETFGKDGKPNGSVIKIGGGLGGPDGQVAQHRLSAVDGLGSWTLLVGEANASRILDKMGGWGFSRPGDKGYPMSWERAVNAQLAGDPVARMFLEGRTDGYVATWLEESPEGTKYLHRMHFRRTHYMDHIRQIKAEVDGYVPLDDTADSRALRQAVLDRTATYSMLQKVRPDLMSQPEVHGASLKFTLGNSALFDWIARKADSAQKYLSDLPTDKASRFPFFADAYKGHVRRLVEIADHHAFMNEDEIPVRLLQNIEKQAREMALYDTKYNLYDVAQLNDVARFTRFIVPFSSAIMDAYIKYGRIVKDNPARILQGMYYWEMFDRNQNIQDENGYVLRLEDGPGGRVENWYSVDPETGVKTKVDPALVGSERYVAFRMPSVLANVTKMYGVEGKPVVTINKKSFNVFIDLPSTGPLVAYPVNQFALSNPEFGEAKLIKQFVLPFGPTTNTGKIFLPGSVRNAWDAFVAEDGLTAEGQAKAIFQAELIAYSRGERDKPPSFAEVRNRAGMMKTLRFMTSFFSPLAAQYNSPYQPYVDIYRQMAAIDPANADQAFLARYGDEMYAVSMSVTRNNAGIRSTLASDAAFKRHTDLIAQFPDLAGLIVGSEGAGAFNETAFKSMQEHYDENRFSKSVYEAQKTQELRPGSGKMVREIMSLEDSARDLEKRRVWNLYSRMQDVITADMAGKGLTSLRGPLASELVKVRDAFIAQNQYWVDPVSGQQAFSPWYEEYSTVDHSAMARRIDAMWQIVQSPDLQKRDDIRGLVDYLTARESIQQQMVRSGFATLNSQQASALASRWQVEAFSIRESNPAFGALWNRWLSRDDSLALGGA